MKYEQAYDNEWFTLNDRSLKLMCCDCHLVHSIKFRVNADKTLSLNFTTDKKATKAARKRYGIEVTNAKDK